MAFEHDDYDVGPIEPDLPDADAFRLDVAERAVWLGAVVLLALAGGWVLGYAALVGTGWQAVAGALLLTNAGLMLSTYLFRAEAAEAHGMAVALSTAVQWLAAEHDR